MPLMARHPEPLRVDRVDVTVLNPNQDRPMLPPSGRGISFAPGVGQMLTGPKKTAIIRGRLRRKTAEKARDLAGIPGTIHERGAAGGFGRLPPELLTEFPSISLNL